MLFKIDFSTKRHFPIKHLQWLCAFLQILIAHRRFLRSVKVVTIDCWRNSFSAVCRVLDARCATTRDCLVDFWCCKEIYRPRENATNTDFTFLHFQKTIKFRESRYKTWLQRGNSSVKFNEKPPLDEIINKSSSCTILPSPLRIFLSVKN